MPSPIHPHTDPTAHLAGLPASACSHPSAHPSFITSSITSKKNTAHFGAYLAHIFLSKRLPERFHSSSIVYLQKDEYNETEVQRTCHQRPLPQAFLHQAATPLFHLGLAAIDTQLFPSTV